MWITKDKDAKDYINLTMVKPKRVKSGKWIIDDTNNVCLKNSTNTNFITLPIECLPNISWEDEPVEVELVAKKKWFQSEEINNLLYDLGYLPNQAFSYIEKVLEYNNIKILVFKTKDVLVNSATKPNSWMYSAFQNDICFTEDFTEYINKEDAYVAALMESLSFLWLKKQNKK